MPTGGVMKLTENERMELLKQAGARKGRADSARHARRRERERRDRQGRQERREVLRARARGQGGRIGRESGPGEHSSDAYGYWCKSERFHGLSSWLGKKDRNFHLF